MHPRDLNIPYLYIISPECIISILDKIDKFVPHYFALSSEFEGSELTRSKNTMQQKPNVDSSLDLGGSIYTNQALEKLKNSRISVTFGVRGQNCNPSVNLHDLGLKVVRFWGPETGHFLVGLIGTQDLGPVGLGSESQLLGSGVWISENSENWNYILCVFKV